MPQTPEPADSWPGAAIPDDAQIRLARSAEGATLGLPRTEAEQYVAVRAETVEPFYLLLYAQRDEKDATALHQALATELGSRDCSWPARDWHRPDAGDPIEATRRAWLRDARFVLVLASPALIDDLKNRGLALETDRPLLILALGTVTDDQCRGAPLAGLPIFATQGADPWTARSGSGRKQWVRDAAAWLLAAIRRPERAPDPFARLRRPDWERFGDLPDGHYVHQHTEVPGAPAGRVAIELLRDWLADPQASVLCAVFGELGMGKTTLCQRLTRDLLRGRDAGESLPLPVYLDLRAVNTMEWDWSRGAPPLADMLEHIVAAAYDLGVDELRPSAADIARLAQQGGGLILCDGLSEVMNRLTPEQCRLFIERLWSVLPPMIWKPPPGLTPEQVQTWRRPPGVGRLLMTCRSHFFQTVQDQVNALSGQQRVPIGRADYLWATLLPFDARQVETYFRQVFAADPAQAERVIAILDQVHDLKELGSRPYNLRLIQDQVDELEQIRREGRRVSIADLYEGLVGQWTRRDDPKHRLNRDHKLLLMERLALRLWAGGEKHLGYQTLNDWLVAQIRTEPGWREVEYQSYLARDGGMEVLEEDLRNATFLVREGEDRFRFAHTSIQEFFLARALHRALVDDRLDDWALPRPNYETLDFLGGLIAGRDTGACLAGLRRILAEYRPKVSELALAYDLHALAHGMPGIELTGFRIPGLEPRPADGRREVVRVDLQALDRSGVGLGGEADSERLSADPAQVEFLHDNERTAYIGLAGTLESMGRRRIFMSYAQFSDSHSQRVLALAQALRAQGIDVELDQFHQHELVDWPRWCLEQLRPERSDWVLMICSRLYRDRLDGRVDPRTGRGVFWEGALIDDEIYGAKENRRFVPVLLDDEPEESIPVMVRGWTFCRVRGLDSRDSGYERLYRLLTAQPEAVKAPLGPVTVLASAPAVPAPSERAGAVAVSKSRCPDPQSQSLSDVLAAARVRKQQLAREGKDTSGVDEQIVELKRHLRAGGLLRVGDDLLDGRYELVDTLGKGGFATIFKSYDHRLERWTAIKVLHGHHGDDKSRVERFFRGARKMGGLHHPGIVQVLDSGRGEEGHYFFVMEYLPGGDLRQAVLSGVVSPDRAADLILSVGRALTFAHGRRLIHRDIKPANIVLDAGGAPKLTDFDLVWAADTTGGTESGMMGTYVYAAPEMMQRPQDVDARADVYSLGMTAVFAFHGKDLPGNEVLRNTEAFIKRLAVPARVKKVLCRAVALEPSERYQSVDEFCGGLTEVCRLA
jgi:tRNA A-37 threonylcarbamoyl transferase component Bud32